MLILDIAILDIMPHLGDAPHGNVYFMHGDWRIWSHLIMRLAVVVNNRQVREDPNMQYFTWHEHSLKRRGS